MYAMAGHDTPREDHAAGIDMPYWIGPVEAACETLATGCSCRCSSITITGSLAANDNRGHRLLAMMETLAERYDLEVNLDISGASFTARFNIIAGWSPQQYE